MALKKTTIALATAALISALVMSGCGRVEDPAQDPSSSEPTVADTASTPPTQDTNESIIVGTIDKVTAMDPAGSFDHASLMMHVHVYSFIYSFVPGQAAPQLDAAESCDFVEPTVFECKIKDGMKFVNGHDLTSSDVKFTFDRQMAINDPNGPASLLGNLASIDAPDAKTVRFNLKAANDQTFMQVLATSVGPIVDEESFPADKLISDEDIVAAKAFSGPYTVTSYAKNDSVEFAPNPDYIGVLPKPVNSGITQKTFTDATNLKLSISNGDIDVAYRSLTPTDIESLQADPNVKVWSEKGGEIRYIVFNMNTMPGDDDAQKFAIRQAMAASVDRQALSDQVYKGQYLPLCSYVPDGFVGATTAVCDNYGSTPDKAKAEKYLTDAGVKTPVTLNIQYNPDHYGSSSDQEYGLIKQQLESTGLFTVNLQSTEWVTYNKERVADTYPIYQLGWFPDYPDADNYLTPFFGTDNFLENHFSNADIDSMITAQVSEVDAAKRTDIIKNIQETMAAKHLSTLPLLQGSQWAVSRAEVTGVSLTVSECLFYGTLTR